MEISSGKRQSLTFEGNDDVGQLPDIFLPGILERIASFLPANDVACGLRLANKAAAAHLRSHNVVKLSMPSLPSAFAARWASPEAMRCLTVAKRKRLLILTATSGSLANLQAVLPATWLLPFQQLSEAAATAGHRHLLTWLLRHEKWPPGSLFKAAASGGQRDLCEWLLYDSGGLYRMLSPELAEALEAAARKGHLGLLNWLLETFPYQRYSMQVVRGAAFGCDLATLQRLHTDWRAGLADDGSDDDDDTLSALAAEELLTAAAASPTPDWTAKLEWLLGVWPQDPSNLRGLCYHAATCRDAAGRLAWMRQHGLPVDEAAAVAAAERGDTEALSYLVHEVGLRPRGEAVLEAASRAAEGGHLAALQLLAAAVDLAAEGEPGMDVQWVAARAAERGQMEVVAWLVEVFGLAATAAAEGAAVVALTADLFRCAAASGNVEMLAWLRERGCEWDARAVDCAARGGSLAALEWLLDRGCPMQTDGRPYVSAAYDGDLATLRALRRLGCPWGPPGEVFRGCLSFTHLTGIGSFCIVLPVLRWLLDAGCPMVWDDAEDAAENRLEASPIVISWLRQERRRRERQPEQQ